MTYTYRFRLPLTCPDDGPVLADPERALRANGLNRELADTWLNPGDEFTVDLGDFEQTYWRLRDPAGATVVQVLSRWHCSSCGRAHWARLEFTLEPAAERARFLGAETVPLTTDQLERSHFIDDDAPDYAAALPPGAEREILISALR